MCHGIIIRSVSFPCSSMVEQQTVNLKVVGSSPTGGALRLASLAQGYSLLRVEGPE